MGNWEMVNLYFSELHPTSLYRKPRIESLHQILLQARTRHGSILVPTTTSGIKSIIKALRSGGVVGILPDQDPGKGNGVYTPFFNIPCNTVPLVNRIVQKVNPVVLVAHTIRLPRGRGFELFLERCPDEIHDPDPVVSTNAFNQAIEKIVRKMPEQYQWTYKRFKYQPDNKNLYE
jgi:KDO2-lipid IV(A) lauroyltransferase